MAIDSMRLAAAERAKPAIAHSRGKNAARMAIGRKATAPQNMVTAM
jgi:hypothetical protein